MTEDAAIAIDRTTLQSVYTCTQPGGRDGGDGAQQRMAAVRARETREREEAVDLDLLW
jgi:hypothetical protein